MASFRESVLVSTIFTVFGGPGIVLFFFPLWMTGFRVAADQPLPQTIAGIELIVFGLFPLLESIRRLVVTGRGTLMPIVPTEQLVVNGLYRYVRNPMYVGVLLALSGEVILFNRNALIVYAVLVSIAMHCFVYFYEEPTLTRTYPLEYALYREHVPRWIPRLTPWRAPERLTAEI